MINFPSRRARYTLAGILFIFVFYVLPELTKQGTPNTTINGKAAANLNSKPTATPEPQVPAEKPIPPVGLKPPAGHPTVQEPLAEPVPVKAEPAPAKAAAPEDHFKHEKEFFQKDAYEYENPKFDSKKLAQYAPHLYKGPGGPTFATYLATRGGTMMDPYFLAAQQMAYRLLWDPRSKSNVAPLTVFVAPHIPETQREMLRAAGAVVTELPLIEWNPTHQTSERWRDLFSKLNLWNQTQYSKIIFFDVDAFALKNIDVMFEEDFIGEQMCNAELLDPEDKPHQKYICPYTFGVTDTYYGDINVGVVVFAPNKDMHRSLIRKTVETDKYDDSMAEQAFLNYIFRPDGPFPYAKFDKVFNHFDTSPDDGQDMYVLHEKLWAMWFADDMPWTKNLFGDTWRDMIALYESPQFETLRAKDGPRQDL